MAKVLLVASVEAALQLLVLETPVRWDCPRDGCDGKPRWFDYLELAGGVTPRCLECEGKLEMKETGQ